jgi:hypothetical protein
MADTISFYAADMTFRGDKEGEGKVTLVIPATEIEKVAAFYAKNYGKRLGCALTVDQSTEYKGTEENITTGEIKDKEGG